MTLSVFKRILSAALLLAAVYAVSQVVYPTTWNKVVSPIASAVWGS
jgi:hypothetical protein